MNHHSSVALGNWVVPFFLLFVFALLVLIDYRVFRKLRTFDRIGKWGGSSRFSLISFILAGFTCAFYLWCFFFIALNPKLQGMGGAWRVEVFWLSV
jgi:hypothetical protein